MGRRRVRSVPDMRESLVGWIRSLVGSQALRESECIALEFSMCSVGVGSKCTQDLQRTSVVSPHEVL